MLHDLRYAFRLRSKSPIFTAVDVVSLAPGIAAGSAIFSLVSAAIGEPRSIDGPSDLAAVFMTDQRNPGTPPLSHRDCKNLPDQHRVFSGMAAFWYFRLPDPRTFAGSSLSLGADAFAATFCPVRRATQIDPFGAPRTE